MTDAPKQPLPGLPEPEQKPLTPLDNAAIDMHTAVIEVIVQARAENPALAPTEAAAEVLRMVGETLAQATSPLVVRTAHLIAFEQSHATAMSFIDVGRAKKALEELADRRRKAERTSGLILPGGG